ncbi:MAG: hypothetical protein ABI559_03320 [Chloroflexota bacterium]
MRNLPLACLALSLTAIVAACSSAGDSPSPTSEAVSGTPRVTASPLPTPTPVATPPPTSAISPTPFVSPLDLSAYPAGSVGYAISFPQCGGAYPSAPFDFGIIGITDGSALTRNPCFGDEYRWALNGHYHPSIYMNTNLRKANLPDPNPPNCDDGCVAYQNGWDTAADAYDYAVSENAVAPVWWLDVQIVSSWSPNLSLNERALVGAADFLHAKGIRVGISSTHYQWTTIAGEAQHNQTVWDASAGSPEQAKDFCREGKDFGGGRTELIAWVGQYETVTACGVPSPTSR